MANERALVFIEHHVGGLDHHFRPIALLKTKLFRDGF